MYSTENINNLDNLDNINGKYKYKAETHLHTSQASACAWNTGAEMARAYENSGYCAIVVTDHFFNGNSSIGRVGSDGKNYAWDKRISLFMKGYEDAKREGDKIGLDVYFGFEYNSSGTEFLIYNYGEEKLRNYPEIVSDKLETVLAKIRNEGGFIIHAHPYREAPYISQPGRLFPDYADAVEVINAHNRNALNKLALEYAEEYNLIKFSGTDSHSVMSHDGGLAFPRKPESLCDITDMTRRKDYMLLGEQFLK